jgi:hypothetical protein
MYRFVSRHANGALVVRPLGFVVEKVNRLTRYSLEIGSF